MSISEGKLRHMTALSNKNGIIAAAAMDQRGSLQKSIASGKGIPIEQVTPEMMDGIQSGGLQGPDAPRQRDSAGSRIWTSGRQGTRQKCRPAAGLRRDRLRQHQTRPSAGSAAARLRQTYRGLGRRCRQNPYLLFAVRRRRS